MVAASVPRFGFIAEPNLARCFLHRAHDALEAGRLIESGTLLRESVRRQLWAECVWKDCLPEGATDRTPPRTLLAALKKSGFVSQCGYEIAVDIIATGNRAAHCKTVDPGDLRASIALWHTSIDNDPCGEPTERVEHCKPVVEPCDCDDDEWDAADYWKPEFWTPNSEGGAL